MFIFYCLSVFFLSYSDDSESYKAPRQYIFADKDQDDFSTRTSNAPFTDITPHPLVLTNSAFENLFYANTSIQAKSQGSPNVALRGSSQAARVAFVLNEIPLNFADGFGGSSLFIPLEIIKNIHVIEGPSSALYGANAMSGAIHFKTKNFTSPSLRLGIGDANKVMDPSLTTTNTSLVLPYSFSEKNKIQSSMFLENDRGNFRHTTNGMSQERQNNEQNLRRFTLGSNHDLGNWKINSFALYSGLNKTTPGPLLNPLITTQKSDAFFAAVNAQYKSNNHFSQSVIALSRFDSKYIDTSGNNNSDSDKVFASEIFIQKLSSHLFSQTLFDLNWNRYQSSYTGRETFDRLEPEVAQTLIYEPVMHLTIEPSVRYLTKYKELLTQIHIPYKIDTARLWLSASEGYRPPSLTDFYAQTPYFIGNTDLQPERSLQTEVGLGWDFEFISVSSTVYQTKYSNLFRSISISPGVSSKTNVATAHARGLNMGLELRPHSSWEIRWNHSLISTQDTSTNTSLPFAPNNQSFGSISYKNKKWIFTGQHTLWSSFLDTDFNTGNLTRIKEWQGTDFLVSYQAHKKFSMGLAAFNIFDKPRQLSYDFPEPQRRLFLNLDIQL